MAVNRAGFMGVQEVQSHLAPMLKEGCVLCTRLSKPFPISTWPPPLLPSPPPVHWVTAWAPQGGGKKREGGRGREKKQNETA